MSRCGETRVGLVSVHDVHEPWARSSNFGGMIAALERHVGEVVCYGPVRLPLDPLRRTVAQVSRAVTGRPMPHYGMLGAWELGRTFRRRFLARPTDIVFAPKCSAGAAFLDLPVPLVYSSDATFRLMQDYYPEMVGLRRGGAWVVDEFERRAIRRADALLYRCRWAAGSAIADYGADPDKVHIVATGANLAAEDVPPRDAVLARRPGPVCRLLLVGVDWERKGAGVALQALGELERRGIAAELTVVGCRPPAGVAHPRLRVQPFLDKGRPAERERLLELFRQADLFVFPTQAEAWGNVLCEAAAFGLPAVASGTGGVPEVVSHGETGLLVAPDAPPHAWAQAIAEVWGDPARYRAMVRAARDTYEALLSWDVWGRRVRDEVVAPLLGWRRRTPGRLEPASVA